jgi:hypothetical protein
VIDSADIVREAMLRQLTSKVACKSFLMIKLAYLPAEKLPQGKHGCSADLPALRPQLQRNFFLTCRLLPAVSDFLIKGQESFPIYS